MQREIRKGQIVLFQNDPITCLFYVAKGTIKQYQIDHNGNELFAVFRAQGEIFPLSGLVGAKKSSFYYEAYEDCVLEIRDLADFKVCDIARQAITLYVEALHRITDLEAHSAQERVNAARDYLANKSGHEPTQQLISEASNTSRETVSLRLKKRNKQSTS